MHNLPENNMRFTHEFQVGIMTVQQITQSRGKYLPGMVLNVSVDIVTSTFLIRITQ